MVSKSKKFEVVRASAGSGKTFRLVLRYLECALQYNNPKSFSRILALTFTNKAAAEMKSRVLSDLKELAIGKGDKLGKLSENLAISEKVIISRAKLLHKEMLHRYSDIAVMTIDSFVNRLVRSFARDLALEQDFRIELDSNKVIDDAVSQLLDKVGLKEHELLTNLLEGFANQQVREDKDYRVRKPLINFGRSIVKENMREVISILGEIKLEDYKKISKELYKTTQQSEARLAQSVKEAREKIELLGMKTGDFSRSIVPNQLKKMKLGRVKELKPLIRLHLTDPTTMVRKTASESLRQNALDLGPHLLPIYEAAVSMLPETEDGKKYLLAKKLSMKIELMGTLSELYKEIEKVQVDNNIRTLQAINDKIAEIVQNNPAPFIYERLGSRFSNIFIDEFQDTSITQWHNLVVLFDHALGLNNKTLVVGDGKQAIYRWRNGDYAQLLELPKLLGDVSGIALKDAENSLKREFLEENLTDNWRSGIEIVNWNNSLFSEIKNHLPEELSNVYSSLKQEPKKTFNGGVHLEMVVGINAEERRLIHTELIINRIKAYEDQGFNRGDITILVRQNTEGARLAQELVNNDITPKTEESLQLKRHPGPLAIVALVRWLLRPDDYRQGATLIQCLSALMPESSQIDEAKILDEYVEMSRLDTGRMLDDLFPNLKATERSSEPLVGFIGHACAEFGITSRYSAYAEGLIELAREVGGTEESGLHGFLRLWDGKENSRSIVTSSSKDSVQIMTVHKAKGLAFKVVIVLISARDYDKFSGLIPVVLDEKTEMPIGAAMLEETDMANTSVDEQCVKEKNRQIIDNVNVAYVAFTRPVERLDIVIELKNVDFDRESPKTVGELIVKSLEILNGGELRTGALTPDSEKEIDSSNHIEPIHPLNFHTGEVVKHLVSQPPAEGTESVPDGLNPRQLGTEVHKVLEKLNSVEDWAEVKRTLGLGFRMSHLDRDKVVERVEKVLDNPETLRFFKLGLHVESECDFADSDGMVIRPDRIVKADDVWHVIDFKSTSLNSNSHEKQVSRYVRTLSEIEEEVVKGWILYTNPLKLVPVTIQEELF